MRSVGPVEVHEQVFQTVRLPTARFHAGPEVAVSVFPGNQTLVNDVNRTGGSNYRRIARLFGYADERRYARHHDLTHHWLAAARGETCSPTLLAAAEGGEWPGHATEERWVNAAQRVWSRERFGLDQLDDDVAALKEALGAMWRELVVEHWTLLDMVR